MTMEMIMMDPIAKALGKWSADLTVGAILFRVFLTLLMGGVIGWERSNKRHSAGLRTFMLTFLIGVIAVHSVFYSSRNQIKGLTTAVALWVSVIAGVSLGMGCYTVGLTAFTALLCILRWFPPLEAALNNRSNHFEVHLELTNSVSLQDFVTVIRRLGLRIDEIEQNPAYVGSGLSVYSISISVSSEMLKKYKTHTEIIDALKDPGLCVSY